MASARETVVDRDHDGQRLDNFLLGRLGDVPRSLVYRLIRTGQVRINGKRARPKQRLDDGDRVRIPPQVSAEPDGRLRLPADRIEQVRQSIIYRQDEYLVVDKPAGMAAQSGSGLAWGLADLVAAVEPRALPVHRLDRDTSGLTLFALGAANARQLQQRLRDGGIEKRYLALLDGHLASDRVEVDRPLKKIRDAGGEARTIVTDRADEDGQRAVSIFRRLERLPANDYVEVEILTGRTHQIRVHAESLGAPLVGDRRYNPAGRAAARLFLHAAALRLDWPDDQVIESPLPVALVEMLEAAR
ncbi:MAG: RluA family pseudouridine synthase [Wenzhouxiangellaceae bacterium]|nr:RluA family pseudouridine synthase [Wenzhouxiangellaceae bacterium]